MNLTPDAFPEDNLRNLIVEALARHTKIPKTRIISQPNREKYWNPENPLDATPELDEVFYLMRALNARALRNSSIAADEMGRLNFSVAIARFATDIADAIHDRPFTYVEMGPEPIKTTCLIRCLRAHGVRLTGYIGIDINPASEKPMREALASEIEPSMTHFCFRDFANLASTDVHTEDFPSLITMLGFQDGNEHPYTIARRLKKIVLPGDLVASEMHVGTKSTFDKIQEFYESPEMKRFSRLAFERIIGMLPSEYCIHTLDIDAGFASPVPVCVTSESFEDPDTGTTSLCATNWCLKLSPLQHRYTREAGTNMQIIAERRTGDRTISFQLAEAAAYDRALVRTYEPLATTLPENTNQMEKSQ